MYDITTGDRDFIANGVVSQHPLRAPNAHLLLRRGTGTSSGRSWSRSICRKLPAGRAGAFELEAELVALGTNTHPDQWAESRYLLMPEILAALEAAQTPVSVLTSCCC